MHDAVDDRGGHVAVSEHLAPPSKLQIRTERHAPLLVGIRDDLEQESGPVDIDGQVAQLVDDQQPGAAYRAQSRVEPVLVPRTPACWTGNGVLDRFLEDESLFGEFLRTPVSEGGVESLVVEPPHIVVEVGA